MSRITINEILKKKGKKNIVCLTAYSKPIAEILDKHCDIILVGDSVGNVLYGMNSTKDMNIDIAVDLMGFTTHSRMGIFKECCAPIKINFLENDDSELVYTSKTKLLPLTAVILGLIGDMV